MTGEGTASILPPLDADQAAHAAMVLQAVRQAVSAHGGWLAFDDYLQLVLYARGWATTARREYYHGQRMRGTLRCHFRHRAHDDPLLYPGMQDITAWVDFTRVAEAAVDAGMDVAAAGTALERGPRCAGTL